MTGVGRCFTETDAVEFARVFYSSALLCINRDFDFLSFIINYSLATDAIVSSNFSHDVSVYDVMDVSGF